MPKLTEIVEKARSTQAIDALALYLAPPEKEANRLTIEDACELVGISVDQFYRWIKRSPDGITQLRTFLMETNRMELSLLTAVNDLATMELINRLFSPTSTAGEVLAIKKYFDDRKEQLLDQTSVREDSRAVEFLRGPDLAPVASRLSPSTTVKVDQDGTVNVSVKPGSPIIDITGYEHPQPGDLDVPRV